MKMICVYLSDCGDRIILQSIYFGSGELILFAFIPSRRKFTYFFLHAIYYHYIDIIRYRGYIYININFLFITLIILLLLIYFLIFNTSLSPQPYNFTLFKSKRKSIQRKKYSIFCIYAELGPSGTTLCIVIFHLF